MLLPLKHIIRLLLFVFLIGNCVSCQSWREAKAVVKEADSLLAKGVIVRDTVVLAEVIRIFNNPMGRIFAQEELVKAYYLMGRNLDDYHHNFSDAADFYIESDRLKTKDLILRGRINSCMGYLCKQDSSFKEALMFYERSSNAFKVSGNEWYYAHNLLNVAEQYVNLREYDKADSILAIAERYEIDSAYYARMIDIQGLSYFRQQKYDSALIHLCSLKENPRNIAMTCFNHMLIIRCCYEIGDIVRAIPYAEYIIRHSDDAVYRSNAYYMLSKVARMNNDAHALAIYSNNREDEDRIVRHRAESYAKATTKLKTYIANPHPFLVRNLLMIICLLLITIAIPLDIMHRKRNKKMAAEKAILAAELQEWKQRMREKLTMEDENAEAKRKIIGDIVMMHAEDFLPNKEIWKNESELFRLANSSFGFLIYRLCDTYRNLNNRELKICIMVLLGFPNKTIANIVCCSEESISTLKQRLAKKLSISPREMREFLMDFIMKIA